MNIFCRLGLHEWTTWNLVKTIDVFNTNGEDTPKLPMYQKILYLSTCEKCGIPKLKILDT